MTTPVAICLTDCSGCKQTYTDHGMRKSVMGYRFELSFNIYLTAHFRAIDNRGIA